MVSDELSDAVRKLESAFNKKIEHIIGVNRYSFGKPQNNGVSRNFESSGSVEIASSEDSRKVNFFSWVRNSLFGRF